MINDTSESNISKGKTEEDLISSLLAKTFSLKVIQEVAVSNNIYEQDMISVGNKNRKKYRWNHFNHIPILSLLGENCRLPLFHMDKGFIWLIETKQTYSRVFNWIYD